MKCIISVVSLFAIVSVSAAASIESPDNFENFFEPRALNYGQTSRSGIAAKVLCVTDTIDRVVTEYQCKPVWQNVEQKLKNSIGNLFLCLKYDGFQVQGCVAKEVFGIGLSMNSLLSSLDKQNPEAGKQVRLRIAQNCSGSQ